MEPLKAYEGVTEYYIHPDYDKRFKHHDVALIKLPAPITQNGKWSEGILRFSLSLFLITKFNFQNS